VKMGTDYVQADGSLAATEHYFTVKSGSTTKVPVSEDGTYTIVEKADSAAISGYTVDTTYQSSSVSVSDESKDATATITNAYTKIDYSIKVSKEATGAPAGKDTFEFTVMKGNQYVNDEGKFQTGEYKFQVGNNSEKEVSVPESGTYTVTEVNAGVDNYNLEIAYGTGTDNTVILSDNDYSGSVKIYNTYTEMATTNYSLKVSKEVIGINNVTGSFEFAVKKVGTDSYVQNDGSLGTNKQLFTVTSGGETTINLNESGIYSVVEEGGEVSGYKLDVSYDNDSVTVDDTNPLAGIKIFNTYSAISYSIDVSKEANGAPSTVTSYKFTVKNGEKFVNGSGDVQDDEYVFTIASGDTVNVPVPSSGTYVVTEVDANIDGYTLDTTYDKASVTLTDSGNTGSVAIVNTYTEIKDSPTPTTDTPTPTDKPTEAPTGTPTDTPTTSPTPTPTTDVTPTPTPAITQAPTPTPTDVKVVEVTVDGAEISDNAYYVDDSGKVHLTTDYVNGLSGGKHTMVTSFSDGSTLTTEFEVTKTNNNSGNKVTSTSGVVATGESSREVLIQIAAVLMLVAVTLILYRKRFLES
ncbi:MAG: hypothetical protein J6U23_03445, partial [Clostridiales bacterium]|nr:hypothetical protein [Clostridiales bacterium]